MRYESVDALQNLLAEEVFHYAEDRKKASGRALGTLVEVMTYYMLRSWGFRDSIAIELSLREYANSAITHNVEYSLHPILGSALCKLGHPRLPITSGKIRKALWTAEEDGGNNNRQNQLVTSDRKLRNSCIIAEAHGRFYVANLDLLSEAECDVTVALLHAHPYAILECKRVGLEKGTKRGPQTIEKAKQGAYVATRVSCLQQFRMKDGSVAGIVQRADGQVVWKPYERLLEEIMDSESGEFLSTFVLTVGVVSNHGNWFTGEDHNKELKVLAQSYDWLLFLSDKGLVDFINELLLHPKDELTPARDAFLASYSGGRVKNRFTKVQMDVDADRVLREYFERNRAQIESWFNVIAPRTGTLDKLRAQLARLRDKKWRDIHTT